jgi:hypothetical protein
MSWRPQNSIPRQREINQGGSINGATTFNIMTLSISKNAPLGRTTKSTLLRGTNIPAYFALRTIENNIQ